MHTVSYTMFIG